MAELLSDRANPEFVESFTADNGMEYHEVNYPGLDATGYLSEPRPGVYRKITEEWFNRQEPDEPEAPISVRVVGVVKGHYDGGSPADNFDFKITSRGRVSSSRDRAEENMRQTLRQCLEFARSNIPAIEKATITQGPVDDTAVDTDLIEGGVRGVSAKLEMTYQSGAWYGYGFPRKVIAFGNSIDKPRKLNSSERTI